MQLAEGLHFSAFLVECQYHNWVYGVKADTYYIILKTFTSYVIVISSLKIVL